MPSKRLVPGKTLSMTSEAAPTSLLTYTTLNILLPSFSATGEMKESLLTQLLPPGLMTRKMSASAKAAILPPPNMLPSYIRRWPSSLRTSSGWCYLTTWCNTLHSCSPLPPSRKNMIGNHASSLTTCGLGPGAASTKPQSLMCHLRQCSMVGHSHTSCILFVMPTHATVPKGVQI